MTNSDFPLDLPDWHTDILKPLGLTLHQWMIREALRAKEWADWYWNAIDGDNTLDTTNRLVIRYEEVCDWIDLLESDPEHLYSGSLGD